MEKDVVGSGVKQLSRHAMEVENSLFSGCEKGPQMHHLVVLGIAGELSCGVFGAGGVRGTILWCIRCRGREGVWLLQGAGWCVVIGCRGRGGRVCGYWVQGAGGCVVY